MKICDSCTSCTACVTKCPKSAIQMKETGLFDTAVVNEKKCVKCNLCTKICPQNNIHEENNPIFKVARIKNNKNIKKSSSGGMFGEAARYILSIGGVVYGASFTEDFKAAEHIRCDNVNLLDKILKTKYLKSDLGDSYALVQKDLKAEKKVLYSGTPCQVAGLKQYLGKNYENLYTIDLVCHGTPSNKVWKKYLDKLESQEKSKVIGLDFRYANKKEPSKNFYVKFENGHVYNDVLYDTSYGKAFFLGLINNECCNECLYNDFRNYSDITVGDAWGYHNERYPGKNSILLLNTKRGEELYENIKSKLIEFDDFSVRELVTSNYPMLHSTFHHYNSDRVDLNTKDIDKELMHWLDEKNGLVKDSKGVGILNFHYENYNYGANLVAYSLSETIRKIGYHPYVINFDPFSDFASIERYRTLGLYRFREKHLNMTPRFRNASELSVLNDYLDMYVVGSDQVWRKAITQKNVKTYFLDFVKHKNKISYAASFGKDYFEGDEEDTILCRELLSQFYNISVRENDGKDIVKDTFHSSAVTVLDPTLLLDQEDYEKVIDEEYDEKIDVGVYFVMDFENTIMEKDDFQRLFPKKRIVNLKGEWKEKPYGKVFVFNSISKWLDGFRKSEYIVTDSYHGVIFGVIFRKKIICIGKNSASLSRFQTLFQNLGGNLDKINYADLADVKKVNQVLNYKEIYDNLEKSREYSLQFLKDNLGKNKIKQESAFVPAEVEVVKGLIQKKNELQEKLDNLEQKYNSIICSRSWKITKPIRYLKRKFRR